ncbi:MAG: TIGR04283 family arsenosugar biosynthesis glycosyltransferase [Gammaproteobacteria bacterium]|nr:TIGR04283 family arsenosugar biosynthesis glycosyltransferase [Gammaproteobacteria bacterium]
MQSSISIIIPVFNEELIIRENIEHLNWINASYYLLFVDGNSTDSTINILEENNFNVIKSPLTGRGGQISYGASNLNNESEYLLFLHIDTLLPKDFYNQMNEYMENYYWGFFRIKLNSNKLIFKIIQFMMNYRSQLTSIATGDQAIFVRKNEFMNHIDTMIEHPIMEDIYVSKVFKEKFGNGAIIKKPVITSVRYWQNKGPIKTILKMWKFRLLYFIGISPKYLYVKYYK